MALVDLPTSPGPAAVTWRAVDFGGVLTPPLGGAQQRINRLGNRWAVAVTMPPLTLAQARLWSAALTLGRRNGVRWKVRQVGIADAALGTPLVAGGSQAGTALAVDGMTALATWQAGQFISILTGGVRYLHLLSAAGAANGGGGATLPLTELLRVSPADNAAVEFIPKMEGLIDGDSAGWTIDAMRVGGVAFSITEMA